MVLSRNTILLAIVIALATSPCDAQACATATGRAYAEVSFVRGMPVASPLIQRGRPSSAIAAALSAQLTTPNAVSEGAFVIRLGQSDAVFSSSMRSTLAHCRDRCEERRPCWRDRHRDESIRRPS